MRRAARPHPTQLPLRLAPAPEPPPITANEPTLLQALADLLLAALGQNVPDQESAATTTTESGDEPQDYA